MKIILRFILLIFPSLAFSQKVEVVHRSDFGHNYALGRFVYIEEATDTSKLKYIATLKIHEDNFPFIACNFIERFKVVGKELGANSYRLDSFEEKDSSITFTIKAYFAPEKFFAENKKKMSKDIIYVFSSLRRSWQTQSFFYNETPIIFPSLSYVRLTPKEGDYARIAAELPKALPGFSPSKGKKFKPGKDSQFWIVGHQENNANTGWFPSVGSTPYQPMAVTIYTNKKRMAFPLSYEYGRILIDIYQEAKR